MMNGEYPPYEYSSEYEYVVSSEAPTEDGFPYVYGNLAQHDANTSSEVVSGSGSYTTMSGTIGYAPHRWDNPNLIPEDEDRRRAWLRAWSGSGKGWRQFPHD